MRVNDAMTADAKTCTVSATVADAAKRMREADIGDVLVVDDEGVLQGILTDRDIVVRVLADERDPGTVTVGEVCSRDVATLSPDAEAEDAARLMRERGIRRVPVVSDGRPVGMVTLGDLAMERDPDSALADITAQPGND